MMSPRQAELVKALAGQKGYSSMYKGAGQPGYSSGYRGAMLPSSSAIGSPWGMGGFFTAPFAFNPWASGASSAFAPPSQSGLAWRGDPTPAVPTAQPSGDDGGTNSPSSNGGGPPSGPTPPGMDGPYDGPTPPTGGAPPDEPGHVYRSDPTEPPPPVWHGLTPSTGFTPYGQSFHGAPAGSGFTPPPAQGDPVAQEILRRLLYQGSSF